MRDSYFSLLDVLEHRASEQGSRLAYRFLVSGDVRGPVVEWTYQELERRARAIAALLQEAGAQAERVLLLYPPDMEFIAGFLGCLYAGGVAVPTYPPDPARLDRSLPRLRAIASDCQAGFVLTTTPILAMARSVLLQAPELASLRWIASDQPTEEAAAAWTRPTVAGDTLAFLQYTSGSTGVPKGVMVTHANILHNERLIAQTFGHDGDSVVVGWLPLFHDMGLVGNVIQPLYMGFPCTLMSPLAFLGRPLRWLEAIMHFRATTSGGPNFAYELCVRKIGEEERASLDLGSWSVAFNGAEPVRAETMARFADSFAPCGFRRTAFLAGYGLAEATLLVTGSSRSEPPVERTFDVDALAKNRVVAIAAGEAAPDGARTRRLVSSGAAEPDLRVLVVEPETRTRCAPDQVGEIWIAGASVARGYWNRPEESTHTFAAYLADSGQGPFLRTGDLGFLSNGQLFVTGRLKDLIIIRGRNHYPQDIERTVEDAHGWIRPGGCACFAVEVDGDEQLVVVTEVHLRSPDVKPHENAAAGSVAAGEIGVSELGGEIVIAIRRAVAEAHEIHPHAIVLIPPRALPKTSSGKVQRRACRADYLAGRLVAVETWVDAGRAHDESAGAPERSGRAAPALRDDALLSRPEEELMSHVQGIVCRAVARALGIPAEAVDRDVPVIGIGLDSLRLVEVQEDIESALGVALSSAFLLQYPRPADAAAQALLCWRAQADTTRAAGARTSTFHGIRASEGAAGAALPLSSGQRRLWLLDQLLPNRAAYHVHVSLSMEGALDAGILARSLSDLARRHAILRTTFRVLDGRPQQVIGPAEPVALPVIDLRDELSGRSAAERDAELERIENAHAQAPFDLGRGPLLRANLVRLTDDRHVLLLTQHHIITDGWSIALQIDELAQHYRALVGVGEAPPGPALQYGDYALEQGARDAASLDEQRAFWAEALAGLPPLKLPGDRPRPRSPSANGSVLSFDLLGGPDGALHADLESFCRRQGCTPFVALLSAYVALLHRYSGQRDFGVGTVVANRGQAALRRTLGFFAETVVLRCDLEGSPSFAELVQRMQSRTAAALAHAELPYDEVVEAAGAPRDHGHNPLFQASFVFERLSDDDVSVAGMRWKPILRSPGGSVEGAAKFELELQVAALASGYRAAFEFSTDRFDRAAIRRMAGHLATLLRSALASPDRPLAELALLGPDERQQLLVSWNDTAAEVQSRACLHELVVSQAARTPDAIAIACEGSAIPYAEAIRRAGILARQLRALGVGPDVRVGVCIERSIDMVIGLLGILMAGGAYVPLDPDYPEERLAFMLADAGAAVLLTQVALASRLPAHHARSVAIDDCTWEQRERLVARLEHAPRARAPADTDLATVIYTSGSTGQPKGVAISHRSLCNVLAAMEPVIGVSATDRLLAVTPISFDISIFELFAPLRCGATVVIAPHAIAIDGHALADYIREQRVTVLQSTPSRWQMLVTTGWRPRRDQRLLAGGEPLDPALAGMLGEHGATVINGYGPTEASVYTTTWTVPPAAEQLRATGMRIGRPLTNYRVYVLDALLQPVPINVTGQLYIGGDLPLARCYLARPELTAERFVPDPFSPHPDARMYATGDLVRWREDGTLEFLGRIDHQVKVHGFRIELGEIEAALERHPRVHRAVVLAREDVAGDKRLVAYVIADREPAQELLPALRAHLAGLLPPYMVPAHFMLVDAFPLTPSGKVDRRSLPAPRDDRAELSEHVTAPRTPLEETLAGLFQQVLHRAQVGIHDDFFALGGRSLLATQLMARIRDTTGVELPLRVLFEARTVARIADIVQQHMDANDVEELIL